MITYFLGSVIYGDFIYFGGGIEGYTFGMEGIGGTGFVYFWATYILGKDGGGVNFAVFMFNGGGGGGGGSIFGREGGGGGGKGNPKPDGGGGGGGGKVPDGKEGGGGGGFIP